jgi:septum formation inhibitor MinC
LAKLSFKRLLREFDQELEDFSSQMEEDETPQQKQQRAQTNQQTPQQVQGMQGFQGDDLSTPKVGEKTLRDLADDWNMDPSQLRGMLSKIQDGQQMTPQMYQQLKTMTNGNVDDFMLDIQDSMPFVYQSFLDSGFENQVQKAADQFKPAPGKPMMNVAPAKNQTWDTPAVDSSKPLSLAKALPNQTTQQQNPPVNMAPPVQTGQANQATKQTTKPEQRLRNR